MSFSYRRMVLVRGVILSASTAFALVLAGCGGSTTTSGGGSGGGSTEPNNCKSTNVTSPAPPAPTKNYAVASFAGTVRAGSLPMVGSSVQLYAAGTTGNGSTPTSLLSSPVTTDSTGAFTITSSAPCPFSNSVLYLVARGGVAGSASTSNNAVVVTAVLGPCSALKSGASIVVNEVTTVAAAWAMAPFFATGAQIGAASTNSSGITLGAAAAANLVNLATGKAPGASFPATGVAPTTRLNALANVLNACTVSGGTSSSACTQLFANAVAGGSTPANILDAAMNIAKSPGTNVAAIYALSTSTAYLPSLSAAPSDWTLFATYSGGGMNGPSSMSIDSQGNVWVANYFGVASLFSNNGSPVFASGLMGNGLLNSYGGAVDVNDTMWVANEQSTGSVNSGLGSITLFNGGGTSPAQYASGGLNFPIAVAFDTSGVAWVVNYGNSHITLLSGSGSPLSGGAGYTAANLEFPSAVATNSKCNAYVANQSSNTITHVLADGSAFTDYVVGQGPTSVAVDGADNVWSANFYANSVGLVSSTGSVLSGGGYTGGGMSAPRGIAVDGSGNAWVASEHGPSLAEFSSASNATHGTLLSPAAGWGADAKLLAPYSLAIDAAGNIWVSNYGNNTLTQFIGLATPVKTPLLGPVRVPGAP